MTRPAKTVKVVDDESRVRCVSGSYGIRREETWEDGRGNVVRYNLAFIHHEACSIDNGRVLGYDNAHGVPERHWMGGVEPAPVERYNETVRRFQSELHALRMSI